MKRPHILQFWLLSIFLSLSAWGAEPANSSGSSIVDDKKAKGLIESGDARNESNEAAAALDLYQASIDRYPTSRWRFLAHFKIGKQLLKEKKLDKALGHFRAALIEENQDLALRGDAALHVGITQFEMQKYEDSFSSLRQVIKNFPGTSYCNDAFYYIGQGHFKLGHFSLAVDAFKNVGTSIDLSAAETSKLEAGKRLYVKIDDRDFCAQNFEGVRVSIQTAGGDKESIMCLPMSAGSSTVIGSIKTQLGEPKPKDDVLELSGTDKVQVDYIDQQTADNKLSVPRTKQVQVVGNARARIMDGAYEDSVGAVVIGKPAFLLVQDADRDISPKSDSIEVTVRIKRLVETKETAVDAPISEKDEPTFQTLEEKKIVLREQQEGAAGQTVHSENFTGTILIAKEKSETPDALHGLVGDILEIEYSDEVNLGPKPVVLKTHAKLIEGNLNPLSIANNAISDDALKTQTVLKTSETLLNIGNIYKEMGLTRQAQDKFKQSLREVDNVMKGSDVLGPKVLEQSYVQMWKIYYAMDDLDKAVAICLKLRQTFPESPFVDDALLLMAQVSQKKNKFQEAIRMYTQLTALGNSPLAPAAQYGIGECWEGLAANSQNKGNNSMFERAFSAYKTCFEKYPNTNYAGDALSKMADYYFNNEDYARAMDIYEEALQSYQDSKFMDLILFNYGKCLIKMKKWTEASQKFSQLISSYPNSKFAAQSQTLIDGLAKKGSEPSTEVKK